MRSHNEQVAQKHRNSVEAWGIAEWFGRRFDLLEQTERQSAIEFTQMSIKDSKRPSCPFREDSNCSKKEGVCSIRTYTSNGNVARSIKASDAGTVTTTCPNRFLEGGLVFELIGQIVLDCDKPAVIKEVPFLQSISDRNRSVGKIDAVLVSPGSEPLDWCAVEMQAVYFSGDAMARDFEAIAGLESGVPMPTGRRRPDFRSSGPKRLMPQLQIKVPTLRRWGKKTAVVVDQAFFDSLGPLQAVADITNADIVWAIAQYEAEGGRLLLADLKFVYTTLEDAVEGLTAGNPVSRSEFEDAVRRKLK